MKVERNVPLQAHNSFGIVAKARALVRVRSEADVQALLSDPQLREVKNLHDFAGMLVFDKWTCNTNGRQTIFFRETRGASRGQKPVRRAARSVGDHHARLTGTRRTFDYIRPESGRFPWTTCLAVQVDAPAKGHREPELDSQEV